MTNNINNISLYIYSSPANFLKYRDYENVKDFPVSLVRWYE